MDFVEKDFKDKFEDLNKLYGEAKTIYNQNQDLIVFIETILDDLQEIKYKSSE